MATGGSSPFHLFVPDHPHLARKLIQRLTEARESEMSHLVSSQDFPDFKQRLGRLQGIDIAIKLCTEIEQDMRN